jgi:PleD family two-component response regulator
MDKGSMSLLLVDDEPFQRRVLREVLRSVGFRHMTEAETGQDALLKMADDVFDVVLSDVQMPRMNGLELLRQIRSGQTSRPRDSRFLIVTSFSNTEVLGAAMALDVNGFLVKPIRIGVVLEKIERAVRESFQLRAQSEYQAVVTDLSSLENITRISDGLPTMRAAAAERRDLGEGQSRLPLTQLREGMKVARDMVAMDGTVLLRAGTVLTELIINRLRELTSVLPDDFVHIFGPADKN